jgi:CRISPR-associated protein Cas2
MPFTKSKHDKDELSGRILMLFVICYDIANETRLRKVAKVMLSFGQRVQHSVFECELQERDLERLKVRINNIIDTRADSVRFYRMCASCRRQRLSWGVEPMKETPSVFIV